MKELPSACHTGTDNIRILKEESCIAPIIRIAIVINFLTSYREGFYRRLLSTEGLSITIYCHEPPTHLNLTSIHQKFAANVRLVTGKFLFGEKIVLSDLPMRHLVSAYDVVYIEGNPRYLSMTILATLLLLMRKRVVLWAMVHSFRNSQIGLTLRLAWYKMFSQLLVYSDAEASYLLNKGFKGQIVGINNGLDYDRISEAIQKWPASKLVEWRRAAVVSERVLMLSCSRLEKKNKFEQVLLALPKLIEKHPELLWCIIGDGPDRSSLESLTRELGLESHVRFLGRIYEESALAPWFMSSQLLVHPGAIGLTLLHAMAFSLPVVTHRNARHHGPEFSAMIEHQHGITYQEDETKELENCILELLNNKARCREMGSAGQEVVKNRYNTRVMVERFLSMIGLHSSQVEGERKW